MTRRQIYFYSQDGKFYVSDELNGDKEEFEHFGMGDSCSKTWHEILDELRPVTGLYEFLGVLAKINSYYKSSVSGLPGTRFHVVLSRDDLEVKDETWGIVPGIGLVLDEAYSNNCQYHAEK